MFRNWDKLKSDAQQFDSCLSSGDIVKAEEIAQRLRAHPYCTQRLANLVDEGLAHWRQVHGKTDRRTVNDGDGR
jgi:hypothetical protein